MIKFNFEHLEESIPLEKGENNIFVVENRGIYGKIIYSLYTHNGYFKFFNENYEQLDCKKVMVISNPMEYCLDDANIKGKLYSYIDKQLVVDQEIKSEIMNSYATLSAKVSDYVDQVLDAEIVYADEISIKNILKAMELSFEQGGVDSIFSKVQLFLNIIKEIAGDCIVIFLGLSGMLTSAEYELVLESIRLNDQTVLMLENDIYNLKELSYYYFDNDFCLYKK